MRQLRRITDRSVGSAERNHRMFARAIASLEAEIGVRREAEQRARHAQDHAEREAIATARFLANISHEVRTPLTGILGTLELLGQDTLPAAQARLVELAHTSARSLGLLLNDILDLSKLQSGRMELEDVPFVLQDIVDDTLSMFGPGAQARGVTLSGLVSPELPWELRGEPSRMRQIIGNLVGNAVKFTHQGEVRVELQAAGDGLLLTVSDTGIGIPEEAQETIFQQFTQADGSVARRFGGSGLGLSITSQLAHLLGGEVTVESEIGKGSTFLVTLPLEASDAPYEANDNGSELEDNPGARSSGIHLLIAEDNSINQELIAAMARQAGYQATIVGDGNIAIERVVEATAAEQPFDLVLMDLQMPVTDGLTATRKLREQGYDPEQLPIIALTANAYPEDIARCHAAGMQAHIAKPFSLRDLIDNVERFASARRAAPGGPTVSADGDVTEKPSLQARYAKRKQDLRALIEAIDNRNVGERWKELASALHQLAGVAAMFGEPELGSQAAEIEHELGRVEEDGARLLLVRRSKSALDKVA